MDFLQLFLGPIGRLFLGWEPSVSSDPGAVFLKGGHQIDPDG